MRRWGLTLCAGLACGLSISSWGLASVDEDLKLSQSTPDMVPLLDSLRADSTPDTATSQDHASNEQAMSELLLLRQQALAPVHTSSQRLAAGQAAWLLGLLYLHGASVPAAPAKARQWFTLSAHYGEPMASAGLAWCAVDGCQSMPDLVQAQYWIQRLMPADPARAAYFQWLIGRQLHPLNPATEEGLRSLGPVERHWLDTAVAAGSVHAMIAMGILYAQDHDLLRALDLFERAAPRSEIASQNALWIRRQIALAPGLGRERVPASATASPAEVTFKLARDYHRGDGVAIDYAQAIRLYRQADLQGSVPARRMLALIYSRTAVDGALDPVWMRQLGEVDLASLVPQRDARLHMSALRAEPTALVDAVPAKWRQRIRRD